jgi:pantoate kinase
MSEQKSFNMQALRGHDYSDTEFQQDMADAGVNIPDELLYKPSINNYVAQAMYEQNITGLQNETNPETNQKYTASEAAKEAQALRKETLDHVDTLMSIKQ